jgi:hypothetical protein
MQRVGMLLPHDVMYLLLYFLGKLKWRMGFGCCSSITDVPYITDPFSSLPMSEFCRDYLSSLFPLPQAFLFLRVLS